MNKNTERKELKNEIDDDDCVDDEWHYERKKKARALSTAHVCMCEYNEQNIEIRIETRIMRCHK